MRSSIPANVVSRTVKPEEKREEKMLFGRGLYVRSNEDLRNKKRKGRAKTSKRLPTAFRRWVQKTPLARILHVRARNIGVLETSVSHSENSKTVFEETLKREKLEKPSISIYL